MEQHRGITSQNFCSSPLTPGHMLHLLVGGEACPGQDGGYTPGVGHLTRGPPEVQQVHRALPPVTIPRSPQATLALQVVNTDSNLVFVATT